MGLVDDDESVARALSRLLGASGFEVTTYVSAEEFLAAAVLPPPDCLVLDVQLGGMSGVELQRKLRAAGNPVPIVFVTAHDAPEVRKEAERAGCVAFLRKPVSKHTLLEALGRALETSR